ncbi:MAG: zinc-ribbon domain-containing protein [Dehalococcoidia bacterium]|nr:zinc-ribbon domain-containing protein [Dehalococcoidia bacterium]
MAESASGGGGSSGAPAGEVSCSKCGTVNSPGTRFCSNCGAAL